MTNSKAIIANNISIYNQAHKLVGPVSFTIDQQQHSIITGDNGTGKTSILKTIKGILPIRQGQLTFPMIPKSENIYDWKTKHIQFVTFEDRDHLFYTKERYYQQRFQAFDNDDLTVQAYLSENGFDHSNSMHQKIIALCQLSELLSQERVKLSSGQMRKYNLAKALIQLPKLILVDNIYVGLDEEHRDTINSLIDALASELDILFILSGKYTSLPNCITNEIALINKQQHTIHNIEAIQSVYATTDHWPQTDARIAVNKLTVAYGDKHIFKDFDWAVEQGDKWEVKGVNGSGKSTLLSLITKDHPQVYANAIQLFDLKSPSIWDVKKEIGFTSSELHAYFQFPNTSCHRIVEQGLHPTLYDVPAIRPDQVELITALFDYYNCVQLKERLFRVCSTGEQRLILLIRALAKNPALLILDEPFQAFDQITIDRSIKLLDSILTEEHTLLFVSHYKKYIPRVVNKQMDLDSRLKRRINL